MNSLDLPTEGPKTRKNKKQNQNHALWRSREKSSYQPKYGTSTSY